VIVGLVILWYGIVPAGGALVKRCRWFAFRRNFNRFRLHPVLDGKAYWRNASEASENGGREIFRFIGGLESLGEDRSIWVSSGGLAVPVLLGKAETYLLPMQGDGGASGVYEPGEEAPERIRLEKVSAIAEGTRVFVGGRLSRNEGRPTFVSTKETPLMVIFYGGPDHSLASKAIWAGRHRGEYFNPVTPYSLAIGALCLLAVAGYFLSRPAFHMTAILSFAAVFVPLFPLVPPGILFTAIYRRLAWRSRILRAYGDLAQLPLQYFAEGSRPLPNETRELPDGEPYGFVRTRELPPEVGEGKIPRLIPEAKSPGKGDRWHIFGTLRPGDALPSRPADPSATFGVLPGDPGNFARRSARRAYVTEAAAWLALLAGISLNVFFLRMLVLVLIRAV